MLHGREIKIKNYKLPNYVYKNKLLLLILESNLYIIL